MSISQQTMTEEDVQELRKTWSIICTLLEAKRFTFSLY